jgi:hypothetical protein
MKKEHNFNRGFGKKGQSGLVVAIVLVLIGIVAVIILWSFFYPFVSQKSKNININPLETSVEIKDVSLLADGSYRVKISRGNDKNKIDSLKFILYSDFGENHIESVSEDILGLLETKTYFFSPTSNFGKIKKITVYPIIDGREGVGSSLDYNKFIEIAPGMVGWFLLKENFDDSVFGNNGVASGNVNFTKENSRTCSYLDFGSVDFGNNSVFSLNDKFAISFFIETNSLNTSILRKGLVNPNYAFGINQYGELSFSYTTFGTTKTFNSFKDIADGKWHNVLVTNMAIYLDGEPDTNINVHDKLDINSESLVLGEGFSGYISDIMIFNKTLDLSQAKGIFDTSKLE